MPEPDSASAQRLLLEGGIIAPDLVLAEVANAIWSKARRRELVHVPDRLSLFPGSFEALVPVARLYVEALDLALALVHPAYGCFYLALAIRENGPLITADRQFLAAVAGTAHARPRSRAQRLGVTSTPRQKAIRSRMSAAAGLGSG